MSEDQARRVVIARLMEKSDMALAAAGRECAAGDLGLATNRVYYACFYAASAALLAEKKRFSKHTGVRAALHQHLIKPGRVAREFGKFYDQTFEERQEADYGRVGEFDPVTVIASIEQAERFVAEMRRWLPGD